MNNESIKHVTPRAGQRLPFFRKVAYSVPTELKPMALSEVIGRLKSDVSKVGRLIVARLNSKENRLFFPDEAVSTLYLDNGRIGFSCNYYEEGRVVTPSMLDFEKLLSLPDALVFADTKSLGRRQIVDIISFSEPKDRIEDEEADEAEDYVALIVL